MSVPVGTHSDMCMCRRWFERNASPGKQSRMYTRRCYPMSSFWLVIQILGALGRLLDFKTDLFIEDEVLATLPKLSVQLRCARHPDCCCTAKECAVPSPGLCCVGEEGIPQGNSSPKQYTVQCVKSEKMLLTHHCPFLSAPQGSEETIRVVSMDKDYHVECYHCEVSPGISLPARGSLSFRGDLFCLGGPALLWGPALLGGTCSASGGPHGLHLLALAHLGR